MNPIATFTANVTAARDAYAADQAVTAGLCAVCQRRRINATNRRCRTCIDDGATEGDHQ